tara:strand:+ start:4020 stop:6035 length:2016 start_codon:yes stop_codon:yes gene_type:complete
MEEIIKYLGNFHPVVLHLPIGAFLFTFLLFVSQKYLKSNFNPAVRMGLLFSFITSIITSIFGYILHLNGDYDSVLVDRHMWLAIATTILIGFVLYLHKKQKPYNHVLSSFVFATVLLTITGHNGGSLTHGKDYLKLPDFEKEISIVSYDSIHVFNQVISPILDSKCVKCHNTGKSKGNLMLSSIDKILLGGEKGQIIKSNSSVDSRLYTYLNLPIDDEMHMPPDGNSQLNDNEKELIKLWIDEGADFYNFRKMNDDNFSKEILSFLPKEIASVDPPNRNDLVRLIENEFRIERISVENNFIDIKYQGKSFKQSYLRLLSKVSDNIKRLDLSFVDLSSIDLSRVDDFDNLTYLNLNNTKLTTKKLQKLDLNIQTLILSNNNFDVSVFDKFISNPTNERVFAYNTISDLDLTKEISANSNDKIYFGVSLDDFASNVPLKIPIITPTQTLFSSTVDIEVVSDITSPDYRYTIDGDEPDSLSNLYVGPIKIDRSSNLKFKAFKKGSRPSPVQEVFYRKIAAPITDFKLLSTTVEPYAAKNILSNNEVGSADFRDGTWNGFIKSDTRSGDMIAEFSLPEGVNEIGISSLTDYGAYILFPTKIELYDISSGNDELVYSKNISRKFDEENAPLHTFRIPINKNLKKVRLKVISNKKLPKGHPAEGEPAWLFIDEIMLL